jgi:hypothetical protein
VIDHSSQYGVQKVTQVGSLAWKRQELEQKWDGGVDVDVDIDGIDPTAFPLLLR